jgi:hypothetical protein
MIKKPSTSPIFSVTERRKLFRQARMLQNIIKIQALMNDSLAKINSLIGKIEGKKEVMLLTQVAVNLTKAQKMLEQFERYIEKTLPENSNRGNF